MKKTIATVIGILMIFFLIGCGEKGHYNKGLAFIETEQYQEALVEFEKAGEYEFAPQYASYLRGRIAFDEKRYTDAVEAYKAAGSLLDTNTRLRETEKWVQYENAIKLFESGNYEEARTTFEALGDMEQSADYVLESSYLIAKQELEQGQYLEASQELENLIKLNYKDADALILQCAEDALAKEDLDNAERLFTTYGDKMEDHNKVLSYISALKTIKTGKKADAFEIFVSLKGYRDTNERIEKLGMELAEQAYKSAKYEEAKSYYQKITQNSDVSKKIKQCDFGIAEKYYKDGMLNSAKKVYQSLGESYQQNGINVADRLETLKKYDSFVNICGQWKAKSEDTYWETKQQGRSRWWNWYNNYADAKGVIDVYCTINNDGTVTIHGTAGFYRYTNYSSYSSNLKQSIKTVSFSTTVKSLSNNTRLLKDNTTTIVYYNGPKFKLDFLYTDKSTDVYFDYIYTSKYTYTQLITKY